MGKLWSEGAVFSTSPLILNGHQIVSREPYIQLVMRTVSFLNHVVNHLNEIFLIVTIQSID